MAREPGRSRRSKDRDGGDDGGSGGRRRERRRLGAGLILPAALRRIDREARERSPWYREGAFHNFDEPGGSSERGGLGRFLRWKLGPRTPPLVPGAPDEPSSVRPLAPEELSRPSGGMLVAWLGHSSFCVATSRGVLAIDPIFGGAPFVPRRAPPPIEAARLPPVDLVLISHNHYDHLDVPSLAAILARSPDARAIAPVGLEGLLRAIGFGEVTTLEWWAGAEPVPGLRVTALPARHWSKRGLADDLQSHWCGFLVEADGRRLVYTGDTAWGGHFEAIAARTGSPHALLSPIGAYAPRWFMRPVHMEPAEAVETARVLGADVLLPCHFGTVKLGDEALGEPPILLERALAARRVKGRIWRPGEIHEV